MAQDGRPPKEQAAWLDRAVEAARALCQEVSSELPDKSALRGLVAFAQTTPSPAEAVLFIRYQSTRAASVRGGRFLSRLAQELEGRWANDIEEVRRFLGILVRAGIVEKAAAPRARPPAGRAR